MTPSAKAAGGGAAGGVAGVVAFRFAAVFDGRGVDLGLAGEVMMVTRGSAVGRLGESNTPVRGAVIGGETEES
jgi:hypothetical protein